MNERSATRDSLSPLLPRTRAVRQAVGNARDGSLLADYLFLEQWELTPAPGPACALRVSQIRRANPELAAAVRLELSAG
jgi:hypothetical protein